MKYEIWPTIIHYEQGLHDLVEEMFKSDVVTAHENKWYKDTDAHTEKLYNKIISAVHETWGDLVPKDKEIRLNGNMLYIEPGNGARWHWHPWGWLTGILYLQTGVGGEFILHAAHQSTNINQSWFHPYEIHPKAGDLLIFPSYLGHEVLTHHGPGTRLCLPFDLTIPVDGYESYVDQYNRIV